MVHPQQSSADALIADAPKPQEQTSGIDTDMELMTGAITSVRLVELQRELEVKMSAIPPGRVLAFLEDTWFAKHQKEVLAEKARTVRGREEEQLRVWMKTRETQGEIVEEEIIMSPTLTKNPVPFDFPKAEVSRQRNAKEIRNPPGLGRFAFQLHGLEVGEGQPLCGSVFRPTPGLKTVFNVDAGQFGEPQVKLEFRFAKNMTDQAKTSESNMAQHTFSVSHPASMKIAVGETTHRSSKFRNTTLVKVSGVALRL